MKREGECLHTPENKKGEKKIMKNTYQQPSIEVLEFSICDVLGTSSDANFDAGDLLGGEEGL